MSAAEAGASGEGGERGAKPARGVGGVVGLGDRPHDDDALRARLDDGVDGVVVDAADREPRTIGAERGRPANGLEPDACATGLGRGRPHRSDAEVVESRVDARGLELGGAVRAATDRDAAAHQATCGCHGQVALAEVQHGRGGDRGDVGAVVHRPEGAVALGHGAEHIEQLELGGGLEPLVAQLHDVDAARERGVDELGEVALPFAGVGAQVQAGGLEGHDASVAAPGEPDVRARSGNRAGAVVDVAVVGAGVVGLAIAFELVRAGRTVRVIDPRPASGATHAAAGMLAPASEFQYGEEHSLTLGLAAAERYPAFIDGLPEQAVTGYEQASTLIVGVDGADRAALADLAAAQARLGLDAVPIGSREARRLEPMLGPRIGAAYRIAGDHRVDPRGLAGVLVRAIRRAQPDAFLAAEARRVLRDARGAAVGVALADGGRVAASEVVAANALGAAALAGLPAHVVRPVFGDILRLRAPGTLRPLLTATVRGLVRGTPVYLLPRPDGTVVVGATQREHGGPAVSAGGVHALLRDARELVPAVDELELVDAVARARPATPDHVPLVGRIGPGLVIATGTYRNGVLLAPLVAELCRRVVDGDELAEWPMLRPDRFAPASDPVRSASGPVTFASHPTRIEEHA